MSKLCSFKVKKMILLFISKLILWLIKWAYQLYISFETLLEADFFMQRFSVH